MSARLRAPSPADAPALAALARASFTETFGHLYSPENLAAFQAGHTTQAWAAILASPDDAVHLVEADGALLGYARIGRPKLPFEPEAGAIELRQFYLLKPAHGSGLADELMGWVLDAASRRQRARPLPVRVRGQRARHPLLRAPRLPLRHHPRLHGRRSPRHRPHPAARALSPPHARARRLTARHGFFGRRGGVSTGVVASLNCGPGSDDDGAAVAENRRRVAAAVAPGSSTGGRVSGPRVRRGDGGGGPGPTTRARAPTRW